ncbi:MAG: nucleoside recognition domain-containing protein [candidate division WOR-3 bacterium]
MDFFKTVGLGAWRGFRAFLKLMMIVAPVYTFVTLLKYTPVLEAFARFMAPFMRFFRLPGEAAMALILGNFINIYASLGAITALKITGAQLTVLSLMVLISHSQILETAVFFQIKAKWWLLWVIRLLLSFACGIGLSALIVPAGDYGGTALDFAALRQEFVLLPALRSWAFGLLNTGVKMVLVLVGIFILLELARRYGVLERILLGLKRVIGFMGYSDEAGMPWLAGNVFGIVFGAGLIVESVKESRLTPKQVTLVATFLAICHGLFEDTAIFLVLGANFFWIVVPRVVLAVIVTYVLSRVLRDEPALTKASKRG